MKDCISWNNKINPKTKSIVKKSQHTEGSRNRSVEFRHKTYLSETEDPTNEIAQAWIYNEHVS